MIVVDASALVEMLLPTAAGEAVSERLFDSGDSLAAPHLIDVEAAQVLRRYAQAGEIDDLHGRESMADLADMPIRRYPHSVLLPRVWELRRNLTAYDALYVALAEALDAPLVTRDRRLAGSAGHGADVELV